MTNMTPQRPDLNQGPWRYLEDYTRKIVTKAGKDAHVIAGAILPDRPRKIGEGVSVPRAFFKIVVVTEKGKGNGVTADSSVIAVIMPNEQGIQHKNWTNYIVTPKDIEKETGYTFFTNLPPDVRRAIENKKANIHTESLMSDPEP
jgi:endonuclease G